MRISPLHANYVLILALAAHPLAAKEKHKQATPQDQITVAAHIMLSGTPIVRFTATRHYDRTYVYAEHAQGGSITLLDITKPDQPVIVSQLDASSGAMNLVAAAGTAALSSNAPADNTTAATQTIRLMDFSDPAAPKVTQQFNGVTAVEKTAGLILLANQDGVWILTQHLADDPRMEERYARKVIYGESMY